MKRLPIVTIITFAVAAAGCATSPRATSGPSPAVTPRDTVMPDTARRDTSRTRPDTSGAVLLAPAAH